MTAPRQPPHPVVSAADDPLADLKPKLRGILHLVAFPLSVVAGVVLVAVASGLEARIACAVYAVTGALLFGVSALYHRRTWSPRARALVSRIDHANIFIVIAGTYTPFALLAVAGTAGWVLLTVVWAGAVAGTLMRVFWRTAPRWLTTAVYLALGWVAVAVTPQILSSGLLVASLLLIGGLMYTVGGVVYARQRPDPSPTWFGFHEVFHSLTVGGFAAQYAAVLLII